MKRLFDVLFSLILITTLFIPALLLALLIKSTSPGPILYWSQRISQNNGLFLMPKFRTMRTDTPELATHLLINSEHYITPIGRFLRKTSLDEIPQLWSVLIGQMSFVGPRPALHNQEDLIALRTANNLHLLKPGITGWAQVNGRDELAIPEKVKFEIEYARKQSVLFDLYIILQTIWAVFKREGITH